MISCHISEQALRARLLPLARAQIRRHIQQGSLILCPSTSNIESDRKSEKRIPDSKVSLTKISEDVCGFEGDDQQMLVLYVNRKFLVSGLNRNRYGGCVYKCLSQFVVAIKGHYLSISIDICLL